MLVFEQYNLVQKLVGFNPHGGIENFILGIIYMVAFITFNSMELMFVIMNIEDTFVEAVTALCALCGVIPAMLSYVHLLFNRKRYYFLLDGWQEIVNESE